jgi:hypothetical protein
MVRRSFLLLRGFIIIIIIWQLKLAKFCSQLRNRAVELVESGAFSVAFSISISITTSTMAIYDMAMSESIILMLIKETIINCSIGDIGDSRGTSLSKRVLAGLPTSKANLRDVYMWVIRLHLLGEGGIQFHSGSQVITQRRDDHNLRLADIKLWCLDAFQKMAYLGRVVNPVITIILHSIEDVMLLCMNSQVHLPGESLLLAILKGASQLGLSVTGHVPHIVGTKEMVKQEHVSVPSIPGVYGSIDVNKA